MHNGGGMSDRFARHGSAGTAPTILLTDYPWPDDLVERGVIESAGFTLVSGPRAAGSAADIAELAAGTNPVAILTCWAPVSADAIAAPNDLRIVARLGVGLDNIDIAAATARGAWVTNVPDYCVEEVSDHAIALTLAWARGVAILDREVKRGLWQPGGARVSRVAALTVGLVGLGRIGRMTARKLAGFGCRILAADPAPHAPPEGVEKVALSHIQAEADVIVLHLPLVEATRHIVDDAFIAACARKPLIVNVSRGGLIDNDALVRGLESGQLSAAALDVVEGEPSPPAAVVSRADVIATPHIAFLSPVSLLELRRRAAEEVVRVLSGAPPHFPCNRPVVRERMFDGGVASDIRVVETVRGPVVVKAALAELRVAAHWPSDPARSSIEAAALETIATLLGPGTAPRVLWTDPVRHVFGMELADQRLKNWKRELLAGRIDLTTAARAGALLGMLHSRSARDPAIAARFADRRFFEELRIRPYFERIAERNPDLAPAVAEAVDGMRTSAETALVHGDYSPKNLLADGSEVMILDCEVAHWGDPRFDVGFLLSHLLLKALRRGADRAALTGAARTFLTAYQETGPAIADRRLVRLTGMLMLARLEGDSPVDYLADLDLAAVKQIAASAIVEPGDSPETLILAVETAAA